ncbi:hybrid sensor histidine kinase/response regulator [Brumicola nitratireducens]|uniref:histidine kinase n=1 Tax=Glaciecola nitratireducens (strain JCM 12485 / KCTC 12276 / FR1064) TaxID=1085623 RepID=G4QK30_GLANF|nr:hybrid sensor histidine kinase/response regulator [Glaciecola nitratireducens]AEP29152.1 GGDEF domain protein [Glaciecola nitratireducens FR1064]
MLNRLIKCCSLLILLSLSILRVSANDYQYELLNDNDGFTSSIIFSIVQDEDGFLWFGTGFSGILRYDGKNVVNFKNDPNNPDSLPHDNAGNLILSKQGYLWIGSWGGGAIKFDPSTQVFTQFQSSLDNPDTISHSSVQSIFEDANGVVWFGTFAGGINRFDKDSQKFKRFSMQDERNSGPSNNRIWDIKQTKLNELWIATESGLNKLDTVTLKFSYYFPEPDRLLSERNKIRVIETAENGDLYLGTQNGVVVLDTKLGEFNVIDNPSFPNMGPIYSMIATDFGEYWVTSGHGIFSFSQDDKTLKKVELGFDDRCSQSIFQDRQGTIWLNCEGVGVYKITQTNIFKTFPDPLVKAAFATEVANDNSVLVGTAQNGLFNWRPESNQLTNLIYSETETTFPEIRFITQTSKGDIWYGSSKNLFKLDERGRQIEVLPPVALREEFERFTDIATDEVDNIWIGTKNLLFVVNTIDLSFDSISIENLSTDDYHFSQFYLDPHNNMWVTVQNSLYRWSKDTEELELISSPEPSSNSSEIKDFIYSILIDSNDQLWISNKTGLFMVDQKSGARQAISRYFLEQENKGIRLINEDKSGFLWLVTPTGVSKFNPTSGDFQHYDKRDGLPGSRYFLRPTSSSSDDTIYLSSRDGITYFSPASVKNHSLDENTELTNFEVLSTTTKYNIEQIKKQGIKLKFDESNVKFEFATLDLLNARQIQYSYFLEGFDKDWIENGNNNTATYTNLSGGDYVFRVRAKIKDDLWYDQDLAVNLNVGIPFWERWWMLVVYATLILLGILYYLQRQKRAVIKLERQVAEKTADIAQESQKLAAANRIKSQFLANMSHEIRTPLTTVIGQAEAIICRDVKPEDIYKEVEIIHDSSLYLLALLNDILDLTKIEENKFELEYAPQDLHSLLSNINTMFSMQARVKGLSFSLIENLPRPFIINVDGLRLKQILINLLSNALKFTVSGYVRLEVLLADSRLVFNVEDTGIGISEDQIDLIFGSFTQGDSSIRRRFGGSGLGLHLSNQLAVLMNGEITVKSEVDKGSVFTFSMPAPPVMSASDKPRVNLKVDESSSTPLFNGKILLAEDHSDNRRLISRLLTKLGLTVYTAADGFEALELYKEHSPEVVLMDIQMPRMDGLQAYKALRDLGCEKPIIALTANAMTNEVDEYFSLGFDGYIEKPIDRQLLISTIATFFNANDDDSMRRANSILGNIDMSDLVSEFKTSLISELKHFSAEQEKQDVNALRALAHRLSGASYLFGFAELSRKATQLETNIKNGKLSFLELEPQIDELINEIRHIIG